MVDKFFSKSKKFFNGQQTSVLSAATVIMLMVIASRVLGLVRQRTLAHFFAPDELSLFFAAFRLPDLVFEVLVFGTFSSAFIPVFTKTLNKSEKEAWGIASTIVNIAVLVFLLVAGVVVVFSNHLYGILAPGFSSTEQETIVGLARVLFLAQGFFVVSYVMTAVLESSRRFLVPAIAPLFYNLGIILTTIFFAKDFHLLAPTVGVIVGATGHFLIQLPLAYRLGFRFSPRIIIDEQVKKIGKLALPRVIEVSFLQVTKSAELFLSSLISTASYTYLTLGNAIQLLPVGLFGTAIAKAALPTLARQSEDLKAFKKTLFEALYQVVFLVLPITSFFVVLRIPVVRLIFGTDIFTWEATVQTSLVVSAYAFGIVFQAVSALIARSFYALHDTKTPLMVSLVSLSVDIGLSFYFIRGLGLPTWGIATAFSLGAITNATLLFVLINKKIGNNALSSILPFIKSFIASLSSGLVMFFLLKIFDKSVWIKKLSFLGSVDTPENLAFQGFILDTRYTSNLIILSAFVAIVGVLTYFLVSFILKSNELFYFLNLVKRIFNSRKVGSIPTKETESVIPPASDTPQG